MSLPIKKNSLQKTLVIRLAWGLTALWLLGVCLASILLQQELNRTFDSALQETAERILPLAVVETYNRESADFVQQLPALRAHDEYLTYRVQSADGQVLLQSHAAQPLSFITRLPLSEGFVNHGDYRLYITSAVRGYFFIQVAEPLTQRHAAVWKSLLALVVPLLLIGPLSVLVTTLLVRSTIRPIRDYGMALEHRGSHDLTPIALEGLPQELEPMTQAVNQLLRRVRKALDAERHFTANAAHELRTPIATAMAQLQRLQKTLAEDSARFKAQQIASTLKQLTVTVEKLLQLARAEGASLLSDTPQDLCIPLHLIVSDWQSAANGRLHLTLPHLPVMSVVDEDALALLVNNLLDNAIKHGDATHAIQINLSADGLLQVSNQADHLDAQALERLQERFFRGTTTAKGSGLGLAIVTSLVQGMHATMQVVSTDDIGFAVFIRLPIVSA